VGSEDRRQTSLVGTFWINPTVSAERVIDTPPGQLPTRALLALGFLKASLKKAGIRANLKNKSRLGNAKGPEF